MPVFTASAFIIAIFSGLLIWAAVSDAHRFLIPNTIPLAVLVLYPIFVLAAAGDGIAVDWIGGLAVGAACFAAGVVLFATKALGGGDVKLLAGTALWAGPGYVLELAVITGLVGGAIAFLLIGARYVARLVPLELVGIRVSTGFREGPIRELNVPYGVAISAGGLYVAYRLFAG